MQNKEIYISESCDHKCILNETISESSIDAIDYSYVFLVAQEGNVRYFSYLELIQQL